MSTEIIKRLNSAGFPVPSIEKTAPEDVYEIFRFLSHKIDNSVKWTDHASLKDNVSQVNTILSKNFGIDATLTSFTLKNTDTVHALEGLLGLLETIKQNKSKPKSPKIQSPKRTPLAEVDQNTDMKRRKLFSTTQAEKIPRTPPSKQFIQQRVTTTAVSPGAHSFGTQTIHEEDKGMIPCV